MNPLPEKPTGSVIEDSVDQQGVALSWPHPPAGLWRYPAVVFIVVWLCVWAYAWVMVADQIGNGLVGGFHVFWLVLWTLGGGVAIWMLWALVRPTRPESVRLEIDRLRYDPGQRAMTPGYWGWGWGWWGPPPSESPQKPRSVEAARSSIRGFVLERVGERQRLSFDNGADRVEIGAGLCEPEREWVFVVLQQWHTSSL
jgi:hypothetical protein